MPLELRTQRDGSLRENWYGRYEVNGRKFYLNLGIKLAGSPPESHSLRDTGDIAFERSRATALAKLESLAEEAKSKRNSAQLIEKLYEMKTGETIVSVKLADLDREWLKIPRNHRTKDKYAEESQSGIRRFVASIQARHPKVEDIGQITRTMAREYMQVESDRGVTPRTWNGTMKLLRSTFRHLLPPGALNPFADVPVRTLDTVFRKPFTPEELKAILEAGKNDKFIHPILVVGSCTAMRRGDCCLLKWSEVDLDRRFITVKTAKTGQTVSIPIFPLLYDLLAARRTSQAVSGTPRPPQGAALSPQIGEGYVFPEQAAMYLENPDGITWRVKKVLAVALRDTVDDGDAKKTEPTVKPDEMRQRGLEYIARLPSTKKTGHLKQVFELYTGGTKLSEAAAAAGVSNGSVSNYLSQIEGAIGCKVVRGRNGARSLTAFLKDANNPLGRKREGGARRASVRDFHSLRVTWVTLALTAGVPLELVQKVTGHKTTDIVLKHYFQPGREDFRQALQSAMPKLLTNGQKSPKDELRELLNGMTAKTWRADKKRMIELMGKM